MLTPVIFEGLRDRCEVVWGSGDGGGDAFKQEVAREGLDLQVARSLGILALPNRPLPLSSPKMEP